MHSRATAERTGGAVHLRRLPAVRRIATVLAGGVVGALVGLAAVVLVPPQYRAEAELVLPGPAAAALAEASVTTPAALAAAAAVLAPPGPADDRRVRLRARLPERFAAWLDRLPSAQADLPARLTARRSGNRLVVAARSIDPEEAARLANAVAGTALAAASPSAGPEAAAATAAAARLDRLTHEFRNAEGRLERFRAEHGALAATAGAAAAQLADLQARLATARTNAAEQRRTLADIERAIEANGDPDRVLEATLPPAVAALRAQYDAALGDERAAAQILGPRHPDLLALRDERQRRGAQLRTELQRLVATARGELERAAAAERALATEVEAKRGAVAAATEAEDELRALEGDVATRRGALEQARQVPEPVKPPSQPPGRLVSAAVPPPQPEGLSAGAMLALGLGAGLGAGALFAARRRIVT